MSSSGIQKRLKRGRKHCEFRPEISRLSSLIRLHSMKLNHEAYYADVHKMSFHGGKRWIAGFEKRPCVWRSRGVEEGGGFFV